MGPEDDLDSPEAELLNPVSEGELASLIAVALGFSLLATAGPARAASRIRPAVALRLSD